MDDVKELIIEEIKKTVSNEEHVTLYKSIYNEHFELLTKLYQYINEPTVENGVKLAGNDFISDASNILQSSEFTYPEHRYGLEIAEIPLDKNKYGYSQAEINYASRDENYKRKVHLEDLLILVFQNINNQSGKKEEHVLLKKDTLDDDTYRTIVFRPLSGIKLENETVINEIKLTKINTTEYVFLFEAKQGNSVLKSEKGVLFDQTSTLALGNNHLASSPENYILERIKTVLPDFENNVTNPNDLFEKLIIGGIASGNTDSSIISYIKDTSIYPKAVIISPADNYRAAIFNFGEKGKESTAAFSFDEGTGFARNLIYEKPHDFNSNFLTVSMNQDRSIKDFILTYPVLKNSQLLKDYYK